MCSIELSIHGLARQWLKDLRLEWAEAKNMRMSTRYFFSKEHVLERQGEDEFQAKD